VLDAGKPLFLRSRNNFAINNEGGCAVMVKSGYSKKGLH
jgi:hypothetical protein